jgi:hypothetical protein
VSPIEADFDQTFIEGPVVELAEAHAVADVIKIELCPRQDVCSIDAWIAVTAERRQA